MASAPVALDASTLVHDRWSQTAARATPSPPHGLVTHDIDVADSRRKEASGHTPTNSQVSIHLFFWCVTPQSSAVSILFVRHTTIIYNIVFLACVTQTSARLPIHRFRTCVTSKTC